MSQSSKSLNHGTEPRLAIVLLAAGEGSRAGFIPKALLRKDGTSLLETFCKSVDALNPVELLVLTGFHAQEIEAELESISAGLKTCISVKRNPNAQQGQGSSVRLALESLQSQFDVLAVCLSDQPYIGAQELRFLLEEFGDLKANKEIVMPMVNGQRGNPVLFSRLAVEKILSTPGMLCRSYMDQHSELVQVYETDKLAYILDVDTEADIQRMGITRSET
jgi:molybdenum cofactor cytidylyltransferase/nicotine blue oxidoreductase